MSDPESSARDAVLKNIRRALGERPARDEPLPPVPEVWARTGAHIDALTEKN